MKQLLKRLYNWINKIMPEDPALVTAQLQRLNEEEYRKTHNGESDYPIPLPITWEAVQGYFAVTGFSSEGSQVVFNANFGYGVKVFVHVTTGEIRMFNYLLFLRANN